MASLKSPQTITAGEGMEKKEHSYTVDGYVNWCMKSSMEVTQKTRVAI